MKKILKSRIFLVIITMVISVGTTVCGAILYNANQVSYTPFDTTWNVSNVDEALNDLYNTANTKFTNFKSTIAQAITDNGVNTSSTDSIEKIVENIYKISTNVEQGKAYLLGTGSGTYNVKSLCKDYKNLTNESFIIEYTANTYTGYAAGGGSMSYTWSKDKLCLYNSETGELKVNDINTTAGNSTDAHTVKATIKNVYLVLMGEKYTETENESKVFKIGNGTGIYDIKLVYKPYTNLTKENFIFDYVSSTNTIYASSGGYMNYTWNKEDLYSYNSETGKLTINNINTTAGNSNDTHNVKTTAGNIYLITR